MPRIACPTCQTAYNVAETSLGGRAKCRQCGTQFELRLDGTAGKPASAVEKPPSVDAANRSQSYADPPAIPPRPAGTPPKAPPKTGSQKEKASASLPEKVPQTLGRFEIQSVLGAGAFGTVYRARDPVLNREVALKVPHVPKVAGSSATGSEKKDDSAARFLREAQAAAQLTHPNIVPIYDVGLADGQPFIASKYIAGQTLDAAIEAGGIDTRQAAEIVRQLADALAYAHDAGVIHRDIKPANIMLDKNGQPHLMDFGLARLADEREKLTHDGTVLGTPAYMSPEQAGRESTSAVGPASDQYSLGVVFYELLTGQRPFEGPIEVVIFNVLKIEPSTPGSIKPGIPRDVETICQKATAKEAAKRYADCRGLAEDLKRWQGDEPIRARRVGPAERLVRWCRRNPVVAASTVSAVALLVVIAVVSTWAYKSTSSAYSRAEQEAARANTETINAKEHLLRARTSEYLIRIGIAQQDLQNGDFEHAELVLNECKPDVRGWEFHYLWTTLRRRSMTLKGHTLRVSSVAFSPDGRRIVSGSDDKTLKVWDANSGHDIFTLKGHTNTVTRVTFSPDGSRILSNSDGTIKLWDATTGKLLPSASREDQQSFSDALKADAERPRPRIVRLSDDKETLKVCDATSGQELLTRRRHRGEPDCVAISPDGRRIVSGSGGTTLMLWDATDDLESLTLKGHTGRVNSVAFSPDGRWIVSGSADSTVKVWDVASGQEIRTFKWCSGSCEISYVAFFPDGQRIAVGSGGNFKLWDARSGQELQKLSLYHGVIVSPSGEQIAGGIPNNKLTIWNAANGQELLTLKGHSYQIRSIAFSPDGRRIVTGAGHGGVSVDKTAKLWDAKTGEEIHTLNGHASGVCAVAFSPDGERIVSGSGDATLKVWNAASGQEILTLKGHRSVIESVSFTPDGRRIVSVACDKTLRIWDANSGQETLTLQGGGTNVAISPDGRRVVGGMTDGTIKVWDAGPEMTQSAP